MYELPFVSTVEILRDARDKKYAVGAFNICSLDQSPALIKLAAGLGASVLITIPAVIEQYVNFGELAEVTCFTAKKVSVPVGLHLSHGMDFPTVERAVEAGFTSVMFDGSKLTLEENILLTREAVLLGHTHGVAVEGELGAINSSNDMMTDPNLVERYIKETGVDILAVAIGNAHGFYKGVPKIDFDRLSQIRNAISSKEDIFLTLHGGTGIPDEDIKRIVSEGITKICIYTEMCDMGKNKALAYLARNPDYKGNYDVPDLLEGITGGFLEVAKSFMKIFGSENKFKCKKINTGDLSKDEIEYIEKKVIEVIKNQSDSFKG